MIRYFILGLRTVAILSPGHPNRFWPRITSVEKTGLLASQLVIGPLRVLKAFVLDLVVVRLVTIVNTGNNV